MAVNKGAVAPAPSQIGSKVVIIEDPVLNCPYDEPDRRFRFTEDGITSEVVQRRRTTAYFIHVPKPRSRRSREQRVLDTEWTADRLKENDFINKARARVAVTLHNVTFP